MHQKNFLNAAASELAERIQNLETGFSKILVIGGQFSNLEALLREQHPGSLLDTTDPILANTMFKLPFESQSFDLVVSNLTTVFYPPQDFVSETFRVLGENGVLMFSAFAPGSFRQLNEVSREIEGLNFNANFIDMHSLGDLLLATGFVNPVVDADRREYRYQNIDTLIQEIVDSGFCVNFFGNSKALNAKSVITKLRKFYPRASKESEVLHLNLEFLFGVAWKKSASDLSTHVQFHAD